MRGVHCVTCTFCLAYCLLLACGESAPSETLAHDPSAAGDATVDGGGSDGGSDGSAGDGIGTDDAPARMGLKGRNGELNVGSDSFDGTEEMYFIAHSGAGVDVCRIRYDLTETARRDDCNDCQWAVELDISNALIMSESDEGCEVLGVANGDASTLNGRTLAYGYDDDYFGHAEVVLFFTPEDGWQALGFALLDQEHGTLTYGGPEGEYEY